MSQFVHAPTKQFPANGALGMYLRAKLSSGKTVAAGAADRGIGVTETPAFNANDPQTVRLCTAEGTVKMTASGAITKGANVYGAASGKISATIGPVHEGIALEAASADGDIIEVLPARGGVKMISGQSTTASASDTIVTGLNTVTAVIVSLNDPPVIGCNLVSADIGDQAGSPAAGSFLLKTWKPTAANDATPIAATTFSKKVNWVAFGT